MDEFLDVLAASTQAGPKLLVMTTLSLLAVRLFWGKELPTWFRIAFGCLLVVLLMVMYYHPVG
jgi:hypothetical protein